MQDIISLGSTCSVAYQLQKLNKRKIAYPFDWLRTDKLEDITLSIKENFTDFLLVEEVSKSDKFPVFDPEEDDFPYYSNDFNETIIMKNKYNMKFYHDFKDADTREVKEKYVRRVDRFLNLIKTSYNICFIRDEVKANKIDVVPGEMYDILDMACKIHNNVVPEDLRVILNSL